MRSIWVDIENTSLVKTGPGPIDSVMEWENVDRLNKAGSFSFRMPAIDPRSSLIRNKRVARCRGILSQVVTDLGAGRIDRVEVGVGNDNRAFLSVSGDALIRELMARTVGELALDNTINGPALIMAFAPDWALDMVNGWDTTSVAVTHQFSGESVLAALLALANMTGEYFRMGTGRSLVWLRKHQVSSGIRAIQDGDPIALESNEKVCLITSLVEEQDTYEIVSRIIPIGAGEGDARITLTGATWLPPAGYTLDTVNNYLRKDSIEADPDYGRIERQVPFKDIDNPNTLAIAAHAWLEKHSQEYRAYRLSVTKLDAVLKPGQTLRVIYKRYTSDGYAAVNIDQELLVLESRSVVRNDGIYTTDLLVATVGRWPTTDASLIVDRLGQAENVYTHPQPIDPSSVGVLLPAQYPDALLRDGSRSLLGNLAVADGITIDGVDLSASAAAYAAHLTADSHTQYMHNTTARTVTAQHQFAPGSAQAPFVLGANAQGQTVTGLRADQLNKSVLTGLGSGLSGGGLLTGDLSLSLVWGSPTPAAVVPGGASGAGVSGNPIRSDHTHAAAVAAPLANLSALTSNGEGAAASFARSDHGHAITAYSDSTGAGATHLIKSDASGNVKVGRLTAATGARTGLVDSEAGTSLTIAPAQNITLSPVGNQVRATTGVRLQSDHFASQTTGWGIDYNGAADFRYIYTGELHAKSFIVDLEQALAGGQIISKSVAVLARDFTAPAAGAAGTLWVEDLPSAPNMAAFQANDIVRLRTFSRAGGSLTIADCWGVVSAYADGAGADAGLQSWTFTRSAAPNAGAMAAGTVVPQGQLALDYGTTGNGLYEVNAIDGANGINSPYAQIVTWTGHPATGQTVRGRYGALRGLFAIANEHGLYAGDGVTDGSKYLRISNESAELHNLPLRMYSGAAQVIVLEPGTNPYMALGSPIPTGWLSQSGIWQGRHSDGSYRSYIGEVSGGQLVRGAMWDGTSYQVRGSLIVGPGSGYVVGEALLYCAFDGPGAPGTDSTVNVQGHLGQAPVVAGSVAGARGRFGKALQIGKAVTNLIANPSFETNTTGWSLTQTGSGATMARSTLYAYHGSAALALKSGTAGANATCTAVAVANGETITVQARVLRTGTAAAQVIVWDAGLSTQRASVLLSKVGEWELGTVTWTNNTGASRNIALMVSNIASDNLTTIYIDDCQMEKSAWATPAWAGGAWTKSELSYSNIVMPRAWSLAFWVKTPWVPSETTTTIRMFEWYGDINNRVLIYCDASTDTWTLQRVVGGSATSLGVLSNANFVRDSWYHIALTFDGAELRAQINGVSAGSLAMSFDSFSTLPSTLYVGQNSTGVVQLDGWIDDLLLVPRVLTAWEILAVYESGAPVVAGSSNFELMLTGEGKGRVYGHAGGLFGESADGTKAFALVTENAGSWGGFTADSGDMVLGHNKAGSSAIWWDKSAGSFGFYGNGSATKQVEIDTQGRLLAGAGYVQIARSGIALRTGSPASESELRWIDGSSGDLMMQVYAANIASNEQGGYFAITTPVGTLYQEVSFGITGAAEQSLKIYGTPGSTSTYIADLEGASLSIQRGLYVGALGQTNAVGNITATGTIRANTRFNFNGTNGLASQTVALAKLTTGGTNGSITISGGIVTAYTAPT